MTKNNKTGCLAATIMAGALTLCTLRAGPEALSRAFSDPYNQRSPFTLEDNLIRTETGTIRKWNDIVANRPYSPQNTQLLKECGNYTPKKGITLWDIYANGNYGEIGISWDIFRADYRLLNGTNSTIAGQKTCVPQYEVVGKNNEKYLALFRG